jgi:Peptidase family M28/WD40-like Beta Propeller Repeat
MRPAVVACALGFLMVPGMLGAQQVSPELKEAVFAWEAGDYVSALEGYLRVLDGPDGVRLRGEIAKLTGEPYGVVELARNGSSVRVGPTGRYGTFIYPRDGVATVAVVDLRGSPSIQSTFPGHEVVLSGVGTVAILRVARTSAVQNADSDLDAAFESGDRAAMLAAQSRSRWVRAQNTQVVLRDLGSGNERIVPLGDLMPVDMGFSHDGRTLMLAAGVPEGRDSRIYAIRSSRMEPEPILAGRGFKSSPRAIPGGRFVLYTRPARDPMPQPPGRRPGTQEEGFDLVDLQENDILSFAGRDPVLSADGNTLAFVTERDGETSIEVLDLDPLGAAPGRAMRSTRVVFRTRDPIANPALSPDGDMIAYQRRPFEDWDIFAIGTDGESAEVQVTNEIQHDVRPVFIDSRRILAAKGEGRHRRSYIYDLEDGSVTKLFHNNTVRTIAPEYEWAVGAGGSKVMIVSERDGDTVSPERGVYVVDLMAEVSMAEVRTRLVTNLDAERRLRSDGERMFRPIVDRVREVTERVSVERIYRYEADLYGFGSKYITEPGNRRATEYLVSTLESFGYEPELQWFDVRGVTTANVIARLEGTVDSQIVCVVSSHYDSTRRGPGADDNTSGTAALLETARVLRNRGMPITIEFAFFTGEEAGLRGSREYVRRAQDGGKEIVCALNNDMIGWSNDQRLDNTIRYSNAGIRDIQHAAAIQFSELITYDALYYKSTDAAAYYEAYGDIVGGIGSYPVLGNPNYHQASDRLSTINHRLVAEVAKTTVATIMLLASSPSRLVGLELRRSRVGVQVTWDAVRESDVTDYRVRFTRTDGVVQVRDVTTVAGEVPRVLLEDVRSGTLVEVKPVNDRGLEAWDWARVRLAG